eukprot:9487614-Pyramimonas_sp.AAC.1
MLRADTKVNPRGPHQNRRLPRAHFGSLRTVIVRNKPVAPSDLTDRIHFPQAACVLEVAVAAHDLHGQVVLLPLRGRRQVDVLDLGDASC